MDNSTPPSSCTTAVVTETIFGSHVLTIDGFTKTTASLAVDETIQSDRFHVGGHSWYIECCPRWVNEDGDEWVSVFLWLDLNHHGASNKDEVTASAHIVLLDRAGGEIESQGFRHASHTFSTTALQWGFDAFIQTKALESLVLIGDDDCCRIRCDVSVVIRAPPPPPPSDLGDLLLASEDGRDVTFVVRDEAFTAHSCVLAARTSAAFMAEVFAGKESAGGGGSRHSRVDSVGPPWVFRALLHFVYTGSLPELGDHDQDPDVDVALTRGLLAVAHRYDMERLKMVCSDVLCSKINLTTALPTLELSKRLGCLKLHASTTLGTS